MSELSNKIVVYCHTVPFSDGHILPSVASKHYSKCFFFSKHINHKNDIRDL